MPSPCSVNDWRPRDSRHPSFTCPSWCRVRALLEVSNCLVPEPWLILFTYSLQHSASQRSAIVSCLSPVAPRSSIVSCHPLPSELFTESPTSFISP
ncbi:hypothetical protein L873DRAFT_1805917 [Choiromyces venosus 120613-1]|uniref:Uncharacterized protein n=1 Tax=Choiromyces venosus 120613-1 TaxID=1336337 RepID=A0A3N4JNK8_9PEZI|nr:hypothetical protein L873DRAFT_1805917 [Choiromyces venosus 120613-1]